MNAAEESIKAIEKKIIKTKSHIDQTEDKILFASQCAKWSDSEGSKDYFNKRAKNLTKSLKKPKRQLFIFNWGYNVLLNKSINN